MRVLLLSIALIGCATAAAPWEKGERAALDRQLAERRAGEPRGCIPSSQAQSLQAVGDGRIVYRSGSTIWVNRPQHACRGLRPFTTLIVETHGGQFCRGDRVRGLEPGTSIPGPICVLGDFVPYSRP